jgi:hypothetical protein
MCQATFAMMFAKKYGIMDDVNKRVVVHLPFLVQLYNLHKKHPWFFVETENRKENDSHG